ncbi:hypothetical protein VP01_2521g1, partial [Puccinia sorghi]
LAFFLELRLKFSREFLQGRESRGSLRNLLAACSGLGWLIKQRTTEPAAEQGQRGCWKDCALTLFCLYIFQTFHLRFDQPNPPLNESASEPQLHKLSTNPEVLVQIFAIWARNHQTGLTVKIPPNDKAFYILVKFSSFYSLKVLYAGSYISCTVAQWFKPYLDLLENTSRTCLINNWDQFEQQLLILFGDP